MCGIRQGAGEPLSGETPRGAYSADAGWVHNCNIPPMALLEGDRSAKDNDMDSKLARILPSSLAALVAALPAAAQCTETVSVTVDGFTNPFLAGQPPGTSLGLDQAPAQSPYEAPLVLVGQELLRFGDVGGQVDYDLAVPAISDPDGDSLVVQVGGALGLSGFEMPAGALLGVFLPSTTNAAAAPAQLDFSTPSARDFALLQPELCQVFFIGDGLREDGLTPQDFAVPSGAEHLFLGTADPSAWNDNSGSFSLSIEHEITDIAPFCTAKQSSQGCLPTIGYSGYPTLGGAHPFQVVCANIGPGMRGMLFYGRASYVAPFQGGMLCTNQMIRRTPLVIAPPTASGAPCSSTFTFDFDAWIQSGNDPTLLPGEVLYAQWWMRDPGAISKTGLSDALRIQLCQ